MIKPPQTEREEELGPEQGPKEPFISVDVEDEDLNSDPHALLDEIIEIDANGADQDVIARHVLHLFDRLVKKVAQNSIWYVVGSAINPSDLPADTRDIIDSGRRAITYPYSELKDAQNRLDWRKIRAMVIALLQRGPYLPPLFGLSLANSLEVLRYNEVREIVRPALTGLPETAYRLEQLRLFALRIVAYQVGAGARVGQAQENVATDYGVEPDTVRKWKKRLADKRFTELDLDDLLEDARSIGKRVKDGELPPDGPDAGSFQFTKQSGSEFKRLMRTESHA